LKKNNKRFYQSGDY